MPYSQFLCVLCGDPEALDGRSEAMRLRNTLILAGVALALVLFIVVSERYWKTTEQLKNIEKRAFPEFKDRRDDADAIRIVVGSLDRPKIVIVKREKGTLDEHWRITEPVDHRADLSRIVTFLGAFERAEKSFVREGERAIPLAPTDDAGPYGLDRESVIEVIVSSGKDRLLHALVGREHVARDKVYVSPGSRDEVYLVDKEVREQALLQVDELRDKGLVDLRRRGKVTGVVILKKREVAAELALSPDDRWHLVRPISDRADRHKVEDIIDRLDSAHVDDFPFDFEPDDRTMPETLAKYELLPAKRAVKVTVERAGELSRHEILFGKRIRKGSGAGAEWDVYAMVAGSRTVVRMPEAPAVALDVEVDDLRDRNVVDLHVDAVESVAIDRGMGELRLEKKDDAWRIAEPEERAADGERVRELLDALAALRVERFLPFETKLKNPINVVISLAEWEESGEARKPKDETVFFEPGKGTSIRARRGQRGAVFEVPSSIVGKLSARPLHFRDRTVLTFDQTKTARLSITAGDRTDTAVREDGRWRLDGAGELDELRLTRIRYALADLRAEEFVGGQTAEELRSSGLDPAVVRVEVMLEPEGGRPGGKHVLLVGGALDPEAKEADRKYHAMLEGGEMVFLLGHKVVRDLRAGLVAQEPRP